MLQFTYSSLIPASVREVFSFHESPHALETLNPSFPRVSILRQRGGIQPGGEVELRLSAGPLRVRWLAHHTRYERDSFFVDVQKSGPFRCWIHRHEFEPVSNQCRLTDRIQFSLPGSPVTDWLLGWAVKLQLWMLFRYRHNVTREELRKRRTLRQPLSA